MRRGSRLIWPAAITIRVGAPIETAGVSLKDRDPLIERVRLAISDLLAQNEP